MEAWWNLMNVAIFWPLALMPDCCCLVRDKLPVLWIMPISGAPGRGNITAEVLPAVELAMLHLSEQPPPLGNYELQFHPIDSECDNAKALKAFFDQIVNGHKTLMMFGGACSSVTSFLAQSLDAWNQVQLSFAVTSPLLTNKRIFPNFFRTVPSDSAVNVALVRFLKQHEWSRVGTLTQREESFTEVQRDLSRHLESTNIQLVEAESFSEAPCGCVRKLKDSDVRIVIAQFDMSFANEVFCCIHNLSMYGQKYLWVLPDWTQGNWWAESMSSTCRAENLLTAIEGSISAQLETLSSSPRRGISGRTAQEYEKEYNEQRKRKSLSASKFHGFAYDGLWVVAKVLSRVMETVKFRERYDIHRNFTVTDEEMGEMILEAMDQISFFGVTGPVVFQNGERVANVKFSQYQDGKPVSIEKYIGIQDELETISSIRFQKDEPTRDRTSVYPHRKRISVVLYAIMACLSLLGVLTACSFLVFSVKHRSHWTISKSRPLMNSLIVLGTILSYSSIFVMGLDGSFLSDRMFEVSCTVQVSCLSTGFSAAFGAMLAKTLQIHALCKKKSKDKKKRNNFGSNLLVFLLLLIDIGIIFCLQASDPLRRTRKEHQIEPDPNGQDFFIQPFSEGCENTYMAYWMGGSYVFKGVLLMTTFFLAWTTQHQDHVPINDHNSVQFSVFVSIPVILTGVWTSILWQHQPNVQFCIVSLVIITSCSSTLCMLFVPKIMIIRKGPGAAGLSRRFHLTQWCSESEKNCDKSKQRNILEQESEFETDVTKSSSTSLDGLLLENLQLTKHMSELDADLEVLMQQIDQSSPGDTETVVVRGFVHRAVLEKCMTFPDSSRFKRDLPEEINSPENVQRRLSLQLPILHHAYLPTIGGVEPSPLNSP